LKPANQRTLNRSPTLAPAGSDTRDDSNQPRTRQKIKVNDKYLIFAQNRPIIHSLLPERPCLMGGALGSEGVMRHRVNSLVSVLLIRLLAAAMVLGATRVASAAEGCFDKPGREVNTGHWYYHSDRLRHRRCWFFEPSEAPTPSAATDRPAQNANEVPWLYRFAAGMVGISFEPKQNSIASTSTDTSQNNISAFSSEPPPNGILNNSGSVTKPASPKRPLTRKIVRQDQPQLAPAPTTTGVASMQRPDQPQSVTEKDEKQARQLSDAERQSLFQEFLKWYRDRGVFGQP
jgi:hypothetical protein